MKPEKEDRVSHYLNILFLVVFLYLGSLWGEATLPILILIVLAISAVAIPAYFIFDAIRNKIKHK